MSEVPLYRRSYERSERPPAHPPPEVLTIQFENNYFTETCSGSGAGSYLRLIDFVYHSTLGLRVIKKKKKKCGHCQPEDFAQG